MRSTLPAFVALVLLSCPGPAAAQTRDQNVKWCTSPDSSADLRIGSCTALIQAGQETTANLAIIFADRGLGYFDKADYLKSKDDFEQSLRLNASGALAIGGRARVMAIQQQVDAALAEHARAIGLAQPDEAAFQYWLRGMTNLDAKKYPAAISDFNTAIARKPAYGAAFFQRGRAYFATAEYAKAISDNTESLRLDTAEYTAYYNRALAYAATKDYDKAIADYDALLKTVPTYIDGWVERGHAYMNKQNYPKALADFNHAIELKPTNQEAVFSRARVYYSQKNYDLSIADNTTAIALDPADHVAYHNRGLGYFGKKDYPAALADFTKCLAMKPDYQDAAFQRARVYYAQKLWDKAIEDDTRAFVLDPKDGVALSNRALAYTHLDKFELALADMNQSVQLRPGEVSPLATRAIVYWRLHLFQLAVTDLTAALAIDAKSAFLAADMALTRTMVGQTAEAVVACDALLVAPPMDAEPIGTCGSVYLKALDLKRAALTYDKALAMDPEDALALYGRGLVKQRQGLVAAGKTDIDRALVLEPAIARRFADFGLK